MPATLPRARPTLTSAPAPSDAASRSSAGIGRANLLDLLIAERIVLLYSPSGAGKTSLIQAGLIPELEKESSGAAGDARQLGAVPGS